MSKVLIPLADGFEELEAVTAIDVLRRGEVEVVTASLGDTPEATSARGVVIKTEALLKSVLEENFDAIVLPGGLGAAERFKKSRELAQLLRRQHDEKRLICAICAAPTVLTDFGVVDEGIHLTCYPTCMADLDRPCSHVPVVAEGQYVTGQAPGAAMLFALVVLKELAGEAMAHKVARGMVTDVL